MTTKTDERTVQALADGLVLTPKAIQKIKNLQDNQNEMAIQAAKTIADAISAILQCNDQAKGIIQDPELLVTELAYVRDIFLEISGP